MVKLLMYSVFDHGTSIAKRLVQNQLLPTASKSAQLPAWLSLRRNLQRGFLEFIDSIYSGGGQGDERSPEDNIPKIAELISVNCRVKAWHAQDAFTTSLILTASLAKAMSTWY